MDTIIEIYTDGSCLKNPNGPGGWAFCYKDIDGYCFILSGGEQSTTNNRMELKDVIESIKFITNKEISYKIFSDSQLTINCANGKWKRNKNLDLWKTYDNVIKDKKISFEWVKAHNGNKFNEIVDKEAYKEAKKINF